MSAPLALASAGGMVAGTLIDKFGLVGDEAKRGITAYVPPTYFGTAYDTEIGLVPKHQGLGLPGEDPQILQALQAGQQGLYDSRQQLAALQSTAQGRGLVADQQREQLVRQQQAALTSAGAAGRGRFNPALAMAAQRQGMGMQQQMAAPMAYQAAMEQQRAQDAYAQQAAMQRQQQQGLAQAMIQQQQASRQRQLQGTQLQDSYTKLGQAYKRGVESQEAEGIAQMQRHRIA